MGRNVLLGFAGPGKVTRTNIDDLLTDFLEDDDDVRVVIPASDAALTKTVRMLLDWTVDSKIPYEAVWDYETDKNEEILDQSDEEIEARNVSHALVERLVKDDGDVVRLIVAWGDDDGGDDDTEVLIDLALAKGLKVLDITAGLDDVRIGDEGKEEPEPEPEEKPTRRSRRTTKAADETPAEEEKPRPRRGAPRKTAEKAPEPAGAAEEESVEAEVSHARQKAQKAAAAGPSDDDELLSALRASYWLASSLDACHAAMTGRDEPVPSELTRQLERVLAKYSEVPAAAPAEEPEPEEKPKRSAGRPRADGSPAQPRSARQRGRKEWQDEEGDWHPAGRGRLPKDVPTRTVDPKTGKVIED